MKMKIKIPAGYKTTRRVKKWLRYVQSLNWKRGSLDESSYLASLRGASLKIRAELVFAVVSQLIVKAGDTVNAGKLESQVRRAYEYVTGEGAQLAQKPNGRHLPKPRKRFSPAALAKMAAKIQTPDIEDFIRRRSAHHPNGITPEGFLARIYRPGERVLIFTDQQSQGQCLWVHGQEPVMKVPCRGPEGVWFLVNPVDGAEYPNPRQGGKLSRRSEESIPSFRYAVLESDKADPDQWLRFLAQLPLRIVAIYHSGGRSIHALVQVDATSKADWDAQIAPHKAMLERFGADPQCLTAVRLSRLPQAWRGENQQRLIYLAPEADETPIMNRPERPLLDVYIERAEACLLPWRAISVDEVNECRKALSQAGEDARAADAYRRLVTKFRGGKQ